jgi:hypothetical protein
MMRDVEVTRPELPIFSICQSDPFRLNTIISPLAVPKSPVITSTVPSESCLMLLMSRSRDHPLNHWK